MASDSAKSGSTTGVGAPAPSDRNSLAIGADGPILLHHVHFLEQMAHSTARRFPSAIAVDTLRAWR